MSPSQNRNSSTFHLHWRRLFFCHFISFIIIIWVEKSWNYDYYSTKWMNEGIMKNAFLSDFSLNIKLFYVERWMSTIYYIFLLLSLSFPFWLFFSLLSLNFHKFSSIHLLKNSYSMFIHPATHKKGGRIRSSRGNSIMMMNE